MLFMLITSDMSNVLSNGPCVFQNWIRHGSGASRTFGGSGFGLWAFRGGSLWYWKGGFCWVELIFFRLNYTPEISYLDTPKSLIFWRRNAICQAYHFWICMLNFWGVLVSRVKWAVFSLLPRVKTSGLQIVSAARKLNGWMDWKK